MIHLKKHAGGRDGRKWSLPSIGPWSGRALQHPGRVAPGRRRPLVGRTVQRGFACRLSIGSAPHAGVRPCTSSRREIRVVSYTTN
jgi:hypothetical protein